jgi:hypothetical protein
MGRLRLFPFLAVAAIGAILLVPQAYAGLRPVYVVQTGCDTISYNPPLVRVDFAVINLGQTPVCSVMLTPIPSGPTPPDSCFIMECSNPPGWQCLTLPAGSAQWAIDPAMPPGCILFGQKHEPFSIVLDPLYCCYRVSFAGPDHQFFYTDVVCFECEKPVPARSNTWGSVKAIYR